MIIYFSPSYYNHPVIHIYIIITSKMHITVPPKSLGKGHHLNHFIDN